MTTRYKRYSINLDDDSHRRFRALADDLSVSMSGLLRMIIKDAFETKPKLAKMNQGDRTMKQCTAQYTTFKENE